MMHPLRITGLVLALSLGPAVLTRAGVVIDITPSTSTVFLPNAGATTQFTLEVSISADAGTQLFRGYGMPIDLGPSTPNTDPPVGWTVVSAVVINEIPGDPPFTFDLDPAEGDIFASDSNIFGSPVTLTTAPLRLFSFTVELNDQAVLGDYTASVFSGATFAVVNENGDAITPVFLNSATIELANVPEPSSAGVCLLSLLGCSLLARRRRHR